MITIGMTLDVRGEMWSRARQARTAPTQPPFPGRHKACPYISADPTPPDEALTDPTEVLCQGAVEQGFSVAATSMLRKWDFPAGPTDETCPPAFQRPHHYGGRLAGSSRRMRSLSPMRSLSHHYGGRLAGSSRGDRLA